MDAIEWIVFGVGAILISLLPLVLPRFVLTFGRRWSYEDLEPSEAGIVITRLGGVFGIIAGICMIVAGYFEIPW